MSGELPRSHICITDAPEQYAAEIMQKTQGHRVVSFLRDDFLIEDARSVVAEAYISEEREKFLILGAKSFNTVSQNALLKILEEPPRNIVFILIAPSKSLFLPTIRSRLPMHKNLQNPTREPLELSLRHLDLATLFAFVKAYERLKKHELHALIEAIYYQAAHVEGVLLTQEQLDGFDLAYRLAELNGRTQSLLVMLLMRFLPEGRRAD